MDFISPRFRWALYLLATLAASPFPLTAAPIAEPDLKSATPSSSHGDHVSFDAATLRQGKFTYQISLKGEILGIAIIEIRSTSKSEYRITFESMDIEQSWSSSLGRHFNPLVAKLDMPGGESPYSMSLRYSRNGVSGTESANGSIKPIVAAFSQQVVDQRVDWAAMMAAEIPNEKAIEFSVYDPSTGLSRLVGSSAESKPLGGVLGTLPTIRLDFTIHKDGHLESYSVYATKNRPRIMLREEMPGDLVSVLIAAEE